MITYEMFDILMQEYLNRYNHWLSEVYYEPATMNFLLEADLALTQLKVLYPEYYAKREELLRLEVERDHNLLDDIAF